MLTPISRAKQQQTPPISRCIDHRAASDSRQPARCQIVISTVIRHRIHASTRVILSDSSSHRGAPAARPLVASATSRARRLACRLYRTLAGIRLPRHPLHNIWFRILVRSASRRRGRGVNVGIDVSFGRAASRRWRRRFARSLARIVSTLVATRRFHRRSPGSTATSIARRIAARHPLFDQSDPAARTRASAGIRCIVEHLLPNGARIQATARHRVFRRFFSSSACPHRHCPE
jgi:hypothetical protein